ncbi:MAG: sigma-70 family RNA polymerase sigma factor [Prevotella sp.]|nr:sigma-70 family RNA polymerase sigma factor [Prevotella sp.]
MIVGIKVSGFDEMKKLSLKEEKRGLLVVGNHFFNKVVIEERENVLLRLMGKFRGLRYEDLEEIYDDGCLVLWEKMKDKEFKLKEKSMVGYLVSICKNIGMHYLRKVNEDVLSLEKILERGFEGVVDEGSGLVEVFDVLDERGNENEKYEKLDKVWGRLKDVDKMILESYYVDGCKMEEIAKRIGYKNGNSVKSKKNKVLKKMMTMMMERESDFKDVLFAA